MFPLSFSERLLAIALMTWLCCLFANVVSVFQGTPATELISMLCFFAAVATAFAAGALYGREAEYEGVLCEKELKGDLERQPLLDSGGSGRDIMGCSVDCVDRNKHTVKVGGSV